MIIICDIIVGCDSVLSDDRKLNISINEIDKDVEEALNVLYNSKDPSHARIADGVRMRIKNTLRKKRG